jgi:hypothetical protein
LNIMHLIAMFYGSAGHVHLIQSGSSCYSWYQFPRVRQGS